MTEEQQAHYTLLICGIGGAAFGFWVHSLGAAFWMVVCLLQAAIFEDEIVRAIKELGKKRED